jgi:hypothetical protein
LEAEEKLHAELAAEEEEIEKTNQLARQVGDSLLDGNSNIPSRQRKDQNMQELVQKHKDGALVDEDAMKF